MPENTLQWLVTGLLGGLISSAEIISRYRDEPDSALRTWPSLFYMLLNAIASLATLGIVRILYEIETFVEMWWEEWRIIEPNV